MSTKLKFRKIKQQILEYLETVEDEISLKEIRENTKQYWNKNTRKFKSNKHIGGVITNIALNNGFSKFYKNTRTPVIIEINNKKIVHTKTHRLVYLRRNIDVSDWYKRNIYFGRFGN